MEEVFTWPLHDFIVIRAGTTIRYGLEDVVPTLVVIPPALRVEDQGPLGGVREDQAVHYVVELATEAATLVGENKWLY